MSYAADQDMSVPYAECSSTDQELRDLGAMRAMREKSIECIEASTTGWRAGWFVHDGNDTDWVVGASADDPADALLLAAAEMDKRGLAGPWVRYG